MAILLAIGVGRKDGSLIKDIHVYYRRVCAVLHLTPCGLRTLERLFAHNSKCSKDQTESISKDLGYTLTSKVPDQFFHCPLTNTAFSILSVVAQRVSLGSLDEGEALLKTVQEKLPTIKRILLIDGSSINLAEGASAAAVEAGGAAAGVQPRGRQAGRQVAGAGGGHHRQRGHRHQDRDPAAQ